MASEPFAIDPIVVVGAGMAGLSCAGALGAAGRPVLVLEASDGVGGRVRTDRHPEGFLLDRGFQVILEAYPALRRRVEIDALRPGRFDAGALVWTGQAPAAPGRPAPPPGRAPARPDQPGPLRRRQAPSRPPRAPRPPAPWRSAREAATAAGADLSALDVLRAAGFGERFITRFARPFWGGITLDPSLGGSAGPLLFTLRCFSTGRRCCRPRGSAPWPANSRGISPPAPSGCNTPGRADRDRG